MNKNKLTNVTKLFVLILVGISLTTGIAQLHYKKCQSITDDQGLVNGCLPPVGEDCPGGCELIIYSNPTAGLCVTTGNYSDTCIPGPVTVIIRDVWTNNGCFNTTYDCDCDANWQLDLNQRQTRISDC